MRVVVAFLRWCFISERTVYSWLADGGRALNKGGAHGRSNLKVIGGGLEGLGSYFILSSL